MTNQMPLMACGCRAQGRIDGTGQPVCVVHDSTTVIPEPDLTGRTARCSCGATRPSTDHLAFFEYRGPGSHSATDHCVCGYFQCAHDPEYMASLAPNRDGSRRRTVVEDGTCSGFRPRGPAEFDVYYCGCMGWE
jgi:hypothetical protein